jgi:tryptophanyl-tRNA synthetase
MLLELAKPVALILCLLSLFALFHTLFFAVEDPHLLLQPHQAFNDRIIDSVILLALSAGISLLGGLLFRESEPHSHTSIATTLPMQIFYWATGIMTALFFLAWFLETHYIFSPKVHW